MKKYLCAILFICVLFFILFSSFTSLISSEHSCISDDCSICMLVSSVNEISQILSVAALWIATIVLLKKSGVTGVALNAHSGTHTTTPITLKVKLSD